MRQWLVSILVGTVSATGLGLYFYMIEHFTGKPLWTLLLNIDFIYDPVETGPFFAVVEVGLHWLVAVLIVRIYLWIINQRNLVKSDQRMEWAAGLSFIAFLTYFPLTMLAKTTTPAITDVVAIFDWLIGHAIFFFILFYGVEKWFIGSR